MTDQSGGIAAGALAPAPNSRSNQQPSGLTAHPRAARWALLWVLPYLMLGVVWVFSNPPGAAPDESDHLVKAIAAGRLDIGVPFTGSFGDDPGEVRNASIARTVLIPANVAPDGYTCTAFRPDSSAACLPPRPTTDSELVERTATVGSYPIFAYVPMGLATFFADTPAGAFHLARLVSLLMSVGLMFLAVWHLTKWLGRGSAVGLALGLTPMAIFAASSVSTSGVEMTSAAAVAAVVVVTSRSPLTLTRPASLAVLAVSGSALALSRQLGVVALALLVVIALLRGAAPVVWDQLRRRRWPMIATMAVVGLSVLALAIWEMRYDHPVLTGPVLSADAFGTFVHQSFSYVASGVGNFGWLDAPLPGPAVALWVLVAVTVCGGAALIGGRADQLTLIGALVAIGVVAYVTHATVFQPIGGSMQGRHLLPVFVIIPTLAGVVMAEDLGRSPRSGLARRLAVLVGVSMAVLQLLSVVVNARRYAVGLDGPIWFLDAAEWAPQGGWWPWFAVATLAAVWLARMIIYGGGFLVAGPSTTQLDDVER